MYYNNIIMYKIYLKLKFELLSIIYSIWHWNIYYCVPKLSGNII